jgi:hypothetical protein
MRNHCAKFAANSVFVQCLRFVCAEFVHFLRMVCAVVAQSLCKYMNFCIEFAQILCLRMIAHVCTMFQRGLRRVCTMLAHVGAELFLFAQLTSLN